LFLLFFKSWILWLFIRSSPQSNFFKLFDEKVYLSNLNYLLLGFYTDKKFVLVFGGENVRRALLYTYADFRLIGYLLY
jgi:hypothetical protein